MSGVQLAKQIGKSQPYFSRRLNGAVAFDLDDLEAIAQVLDVDIADLIPKDRGSGRDFDQAPAERLVTIGQALVGRPEGVSPVPESRKPPRPIRQPKPGHTRPVSAVPARKRRPNPVRPGDRPTQR